MLCQKEKVYNNIPYLLLSIMELGAKHKHACNIMPLTTQFFFNLFDYIIWCVIDMDHMVSEAKSGLVVEGPSLIDNFKHGCWGRQYTYKTRYNY